MPDGLKLVIWDLDGTLIDSAHLIVDAMEKAAAAADLPIPTAEATRRIIGLSVPQAVEELFGVLSEDAAQRLVSGYRNAFLANRSAPGFLEPVFEGCYDALNHFDGAGFIQGIATGKARRGVDHFLETHDLEGRFVTIQTADRHPGKPDPAMVLAALAETGAETHEAVMIGDTAFDVEMAANAGVRTIGVSWGNHTVTDLSNAGATAIVDDFTSLRHAVNQFFDAGETAA